MRSFVDSEENRTDEDREYCEEYGDNYTKVATSHPISQHLLRMANVELLLLYFTVIIIL